MSGDVTLTDAEVRRLPASAPADTIRAVEAIVADRLAAERERTLSTAARIARGDA